MVRQWPDMIYDGNRACSSLGYPVPVKSVDESDIYPDFVTIAAGYRVTAERVTTADDFETACERMLKDPNEPYLLDVIVAREDNVYPMVPAGGAYEDTILSK